MIRRTKQDVLTELAAKHRFGPLFQLVALFVERWIYIAGKLCYLIQRSFGQTMTLAKICRFTQAISLKWRDETEKKFWSNFTMKPHTLKARPFGNFIFLNSWLFPCLQFHFQRVHQTADWGKTKVHRLRPSHGHVECHFRLFAPTGCRFHTNRWYNKEWHTNGESNAQCCERSPE